MMLRTQSTKQDPRAEDAEDMDVEEATMADAEEHHCNPLQEAAVARSATRAMTQTTAGS